MAKKENYAQTTKKTAHFNIVDAAIILLIIAVVLGIYFRFNLVDYLKAQDKTDDYAVSFSVEDIRYTTPTYIDVGDEVYFADSGEVFGTLMSESENKSALNITPASEYFTDSEGNVVEVFYPDAQSRVDAKGRLQCRGYYTDDGGFCIGGTKYIAPGQKVEVRTELVTLTVKITAIETVEEN